MIRIGSGFAGVNYGHRGSCPALTVVCLLLVACSAPPQSIERGLYPIPEDAEVADCDPGEYGGMLILSEATEPKTFNFLVPGDRASATAQNLFQSGLLTIDLFTMQPAPQLARSWDIGEDLKTYTFHLRRGIRWSDGEPFTAADVIFTFDCIFAVEKDAQTGEPVLDERTGRPRHRFPNRYREQYTIGGEPIGYEKIDSHTVRFTTAVPYSPFLNDIGFVNILPRHKLYSAYADGTLLNRWSSETAINSPSELVGTGPFVIHSYRPGERIAYAPNPHYWRVDSTGQRLPYVDFLIQKFVKSTSSETILFATGQTDAAPIPATDIAWVERAADTYDFTIFDRGPSTGISFLWFNQHRGERSPGNPFVDPVKLGWFTNRTFRQAVMYGFDREGIVQGVYFGRAEPLHSVISPGNPIWYNPNLPRYHYDPDKARALLREAGFRLRGDGRLVDWDGNPVEFELLATEASATMPAIASTFRENMADLGIRVNVSFVDFGAILQRTANTFDYDASIIGWGSGAATDPSGSKVLFRSDGIYHIWHPRQEQPVTEWEARIDALVDAQEQTFDTERRIAYFHEIQQIFAEELPLIFLVTPHTYSGVSNRWRNVRVPPTGSVIWNLDELWTPQPEPTR